MNILFITIAWARKGERNLYSDLMQEFIDNGHHVFVVCNEESGNATKIETENFLTVLKVKTGKIKKTAYFRKMISLLMLGSKFRNAIQQYFSHQSFDLLIFNTPPINLSGLLKNLKQKYNCKFYLLLKDIWPQGSVDLGVIKKYGPVWQFFRYHERRIYRLADYIGCMSPMGVEYIGNNNSFIDKKKIEECPNSLHLAENEIIDTGNIRDKYSIPADAVIFSFSGNMELGHGLNFLINAIDALQFYPKAFFLLGGAGTHFKYLEKYFKESSPKNAFLYQRLTLEDFKKVTAVVDVGLILLDKKYSVPQFPSRLLTYLQHEKPVICAVNSATDIGSIVRMENCGISLLHGDLNEFIEAVKFFCENDEARKQMGINAKKLLMDRYTAKHSYQIIMRHFNR